MKKILYIAFSTLLMTGAFALEKTKEEKVAKFVLENIQKDYTSCYAFYLITAESFKQDKIIDTLARDKKVIDGLEKSADTALKFSHDLGEVLELEPETMAKNNKREFEKISKILKTNNKVLREQMKVRGLFCKNLIEDQKQRIDYWENKGNKKIK
jgi:hypothetical protein|tara:strand:- start:334 stop:798 length:465 start_codon:yes stop_codon:yes gene_type:complete